MKGKTVRNVNEEGRGLFIVLEGGDGSGKTTQAKMLSDALKIHNVDHHLTREPGDTRLGANLRALLLDRGGEPISKKAEALLFAADRAEHVEKVIRPTLNRGVMVICDRYIASTIAYQGYASGLDAPVLRTVSDWASSDLYPDLTFFLDVDPVIGLERAMKVKTTRFEDKDLSYHHAVHRGFLEQRDQTWVTMDGMESAEVVHSKILHYVLGVMSAMKQMRYERLNPGIVPPPSMRYQYRCPECNFELRQMLADPNHYYCPDGHGEIYIPPLGSTRDGFVTFEKDVMPGKEKHAASDS
jgi:dTMP kinase